MKGWSYTASCGEEAIAKRRAGQEPLMRRKAEAPQVPGIDNDFETLVAAAIAAVITLKCRLMTRAFS
jgi:hypothetical protein